jgi:hypothetical protein
LTGARPTVSLLNNVKYKSTEGNEIGSF